MTKEQALEGFYNDITRQGKISKERDYSTKLLSLAAKYVNSEMSGRLIRYTRKGFSPMLAKMSNHLYTLHSDNKTDKYGYTQYLSHYLELLRCINTKMINDIESDNFKDDESESLPKMPIADEIMAMGSNLSGMQHLMFTGSAKKRYDSFIVPEDLNTLKGEN